MLFRSFIASSLPAGLPVPPGHLAWPQGLVLECTLVPGKVVLPLTRGKLVLTGKVKRIFLFLFRFRKTQNDKNELESFSAKKHNRTVLVC